MEEEEEDIKSYLVYKKQGGSHFDAKEGTVRSDTSTDHEHELNEICMGVKE